MKVSSSYQQDLRPPSTAAGASPYNSYFRAAKLTYKRDAIPNTITSICLIAPFQCHPLHHLSKLNSSSPCTNRRRCTNGYPESPGYSDSDSEEDEDDATSEAETRTEIEQENGFVINITKLGKRSRRIESNIVVDATLQTVWDILTDYEKLADFIPGLVVSRLLEKRDNCARLFQIGQQNLGLGIKFNATAVLDCYEKDLETLSYGRRRDIDFKMVEGDFDIFEGKWSIEEFDAGRCKSSQIVDIMEGQESHTVLSYVLEVKPKLWLPVRLIEGRLCREIKTNLYCLREEAHLRLASSCS